MYVCWAAGRGGALAAGWARGGRAALLERAALWARRAARAALAALALLGLVPLMFGLLLELVCSIFKFKKRFSWHVPVTIVPFHV